MPLGISDEQICANGIKMVTINYEFLFKIN